MFEIDYKGYHIWAEFVGEKDANWDNDSAYRHHKIHIKKGNEHISFDYWTSIAHPEIEDDKEVLNAVECFFTDASSGQYDFEDYCAEMGYEVPRGVIQSWKECQSLNTKAIRMFGNNWQEFADELRDELWA